MCDILPQQKNLPSPQTTDAPEKPANTADKGNFSYYFSKDIPSHPGEITPIINELTKKLVQCGWQESAYAGIILALEEAIVNAAVHGNKMDKNKKIRVRFAVSHELAQMEVIDEGNGFDLKKVPDPTLKENLTQIGGRGICLMFSFMDRICFNAKGNQVFMEKKNPD